MGLTIHCEGSLVDAAALDIVIAKTRAFATEQSWPFERVSLTDQKLERMIAGEDPEGDETVVEYEGSLNGITVKPSPDCEPFTLAFGTDLFFQDYTKTQFAGPDIHRKLILLLDDLKPQFTRLNVSDEADYWTNRDDAELEANFSRATEAIDYARDQYASVDYKVKTPVRRLIDS